MVAAPALPPQIVFVDVETTGLGAADRVVTLAALHLDTASLAGGPLALDAIHLAFDPRRDCHPDAAAVHGYSDWDLRHQDPFSAHAAAVHAFLHRAPVVVAHNAAFDLRFIAREFEKSGLPPLARPAFCTMQAYRARGHAGSASLDAVCRRIGASRSGARHGALEDAWLALRVYLWLHGRKGGPAMPEALRRGPSNWITPPPVPDGPWPKRARKGRPEPA